MARVADEEGIVEEREDSEYGKLLAGIAFESEIGVEERRNVAGTTRE
jgi:hypothetical protein